MGYPSVLFFVYCNYVLINLHPLLNCELCRAMRFNKAANI